HEKSGVGLALQSLGLPLPLGGEDRGEGVPASNKRIGVVGLGVGTLASYSRPGDFICFYEINPLVKQMADNYFSYLKEAEGKVDIVFGDARLSMERQPPQQYDLLALDAFSGDAIPVHLLTDEAFRIYRRHLKTNGILAVHVTNRHLDLVPVVRNLGRRFGYETVL